MDDDFVKKLDLNVRSKERVVYILAEIRKVLESDRISNTSYDNYPTLYLYCCWVLHPRLDRKNAIDFLKTIDFSTKKGNDKIVLETFKNELKMFLEKYELSTFIVSDEWFQFRKYFIEIISSTPLINKGAKDLEIKELYVLIPEDSVLKDGSYFSYKVVYGNGSDNEGGILCGDYDIETKKLKEINSRRFYRHYELKVLDKMIETSKKLKGVKKKDLEEKIKLLLERIEKGKKEDNYEELFIKNNNFLTD